MEYSEWGAVYREIAREFGYPFESEEAAAYELLALLPPEAREAPAERMRGRLAHRTAVVVGSAPGAGAPPMSRLPPEPIRPVVIAADSAVAPCLAAQIVPDLIVTDLDGPMAAEVAANARGSFVLVHAHGDNRPLLREWVPQFPGSLAGSWAGAPRTGLVNFGGFTDGDRAAFLAEALGAARILLYGFDFDAVEELDPARARLKRAKLAWARKLIDMLSERKRSPLLLWNRDGTQEPWQTAGAPGAPTGPSTQ